MKSEVEAFTSEECKKDFSREDDVHNLIKSINKVRS